MRGLAPGASVSVTFTAILLRPGVVDLNCFGVRVPVWPGAVKRSAATLLAGANVGVPAAVPVSGAGVGAGAGAGAGASASAAAVAAPATPVATAAVTMTSSRPRAASLAAAASAAWVASAAEPIYALGAGVAATLPVPIGTLTQSKPGSPWQQLFSFPSQYLLAVTPA